MLEVYALLVAALVVACINFALLYHVRRDDARLGLGEDLPPWGQVMGITVLGGLFAPIFVLAMGRSAAPRPLLNRRLRWVIRAQAAFALLFAAWSFGLILTA